MHIGHLEQLPCEFSIGFIEVVASHIHRSLCVIAWRRVQGRKGAMVVGLLPLARQLPLLLSLLLLGRQLQEDGFEIGLVILAGIACAARTQPHALSAKPIGAIGEPRWEKAVGKVQGWLPPT